MVSNDLVDVHRWAYLDGDRTKEIEAAQARLASGTLAPEALRVAAQLGHEAARHLLGKAAPPIPSTNDEMVLALKGLGAAQGLEGLKRAAVGAGYARLPGWQRRHPPQPDWMEVQPDLFDNLVGRDKPSKALWAAERCILFPSKTHISICIEVNQYATSTRASWGWAGSVAVVAAQQVSAQAIEGTLWNLIYCRKSTDPSARFLLESIQEEVLPWVLGLWDPLRWNPSLTPTA
jgi:hypothetical protein